MPSRNEAESPEHKRLVQALINYLQTQGFQIQHASCNGYSPCPEISGMNPDVQAINSRQLLAIGIAKTIDDLDTERTIAQFNLFSNLTVSGGASIGQTIPLYIGITAGHQNQLLIALVSLGIAHRSSIQIVPL